MDCSAFLRLAGRPLPRFGLTFLSSVKEAAFQRAGTAKAVSVPLRSFRIGLAPFSCGVKKDSEKQSVGKILIGSEPVVPLVRRFTSSSPAWRQMAVSASQDAVQWKLMNEDECILVDENDKVRGHDSKLNCHLWDKIQTGAVLHRAFSVFLFNSKNELLLQQRSATKVTFPLVWTNTCCSHPLYRESELVEKDNLGVRNAAQRKLKDEVGIEPADAPVDGFTVLGRIVYQAPSNDQWGEHEVDYVLFARQDVKVEPNPEEVAAVQYVNQQQLKELVAKADRKEGGITLSPWFRLIVDKFLFKWWDLLESGKLSEAIDLQNIHRLS